MLSFLTISLALYQFIAVQAHDTCNTKTNPYSRIDTHAHFVPPFWKEEAIQYGYGQPDGIPELPNWTEEAHLEMMRRTNISKAILSITSPGTNFSPNNTVARNLTRRVNEFAADVKRRNPNKFGFWASLPLPDVQGSLLEIEYALDSLNADGFSVLTNAHGVYLGDDILQPVFEALNKRNATIFIHPTSPCSRNGTATSPLPQWPNPMFEFLFDTARAVINMFLTETLSKAPNITVVLSHAGGALPPLVARLAEYAAIIAPSSGINLESIKNTFQSQFYFDLAGFALPDQIKGLLPYVDASRITYGSDYPMTNEAAALQLANIMTEELPKVFPSCKTQKDINSGNAKKLLKERS